MTRRVAGVFGGWRATTFPTIVATNLGRVMSKKLRILMVEPGQRAVRQDDSARGIRQGLANRVVEDALRGERDPRAKQFALQAIRVSGSRVPPSECGVFAHDPAQVRGNDCAGRLLARQPPKPRPPAVSYPA